MVLWNMILKADLHKIKSYKENTEPTSNKINVVVAFIILNVGKYKIMCCNTGGK